MLILFLIIVCKKQSLAVYEITHIFLFSLQPREVAGDRVSTSYDSRRAESRLSSTGHGGGVFNLPKDGQ